MVGGSGRLPLSPPPQPAPPPKRHAAGTPPPQGIVCVFVGNVVTLIPLVLNAYPGTKYGIPFPGLARASFGIKVRAVVEMKLVPWLVS